jgi:hypothetical protein
MLLYPAGDALTKSAVCRQQFETNLYPYPNPPVPFSKEGGNLKFSQFFGGKAAEKLTKTI